MLRAQPARRIRSQQVPGAPGLREQRPGCVRSRGAGPRDRWLREVAAQALADAGLDCPPAGCPVLVGTTLRELRSAELWWRNGIPLTLADLHFNGALRAKFGTTLGYTIVSACAASLYTLGMATDLIGLGLVDIVVVTGTDSVTESSFGGMDRAQNLAPEEMRPFDKTRQGMLMGEGAVAVALRRLGIPDASILQVIGGGFQRVSLRRRI